MIDWIGTYDYAIGDAGNGASGTITPPGGAQVRMITAHATVANATVKIGSGPAILVPQGVGFSIPYDPGMLLGGKGILASLGIVATNTDSFMVDYFKAPS